MFTFTGTSYPSMALSEFYSTPGNGTRQTVSSAPPQLSLLKHLPDPRIFHKAEAPSATQRNLFTWGMLVSLGGNSNEEKGGNRQCTYRCRTR